MKRPFLIPIVFFLAGVILAGKLEILLVERIKTLLSAVLFCLLLTLIVAFKKQKLLYSVLCLFFFFLGFFRYTSAMLPGGSNISRYAGGEQQKAVLYGTVTGYPERKNSRYTEFRTFSFKVYRLLAGGDENKVTGSIQARVFSSNKYPKTGDRLVIGGKISLPEGRREPEGFDYGEYLKRKGITAVLFSKERDHYLKTGVSRNPALFLQRSLFDIRGQADGIIRTYLVGVPAVMTRSIVLGLRSGMPEKINDIFIRTGTMHILAVSGLHTGIVGFAVLGSLSFMRCPQKTGYYLTILVICLFAVFAGSRSSSVRAAFMGSLVLLSLVMERKTDIINALALSAFAMIFFNPGQLFQAGFILSYTAVLSIIYVTPLTKAFLNIPERKYPEGKLAFLKRNILQSISVSLAVWIGMLPVIAGYFRIVTPSVVLSNLLAIPVLFLLVISGFFLIFTGLFTALSPLTKIIAVGIKTLVLFFVRSMELLSQIPFSYIEIPAPGIVFIFMYYTIMAGVVVLFRQYKNRDL